MDKMDRFISDRFSHTPVFFILWKMLSNDTLRAKTVVVWEKMLEKGLDELEWIDGVWKWWKEVLEFFKRENSWEWNMWSDDGDLIYSWWEVIGDIYERTVLNPILEKLGMDEWELINLADEKWLEWYKQKQTKQKQ